MGAFVGMKIVFASDVQCVILLRYPVVSIGSLEKVRNFEKLKIM